MMKNCGKLFDSTVIQLTVLQVFFFFGLKVYVVANVEFFELGLVTPYLPRRKTRARRILTPIDQVLIALQFYAAGSFQTLVGNILRLSQTSVSRAVRSVSVALCAISQRHINFPENLITVIRSTSYKIS
jgi:hypothetical protein